MGAFRTGLWAGILLVLVVLNTTEGADLSLEAELQSSLVEIRALVERAREKLFTGQAIDEELSRLRWMAGPVRATHLLLQERFCIRETQVSSQGPAAGGRHGIMLEDYGAALSELLGLMETLVATEDAASHGPEVQRILDALHSLLARILPSKRTPLFGALPYRRPQYPSQRPNDEPVIQPAYEGGRQEVLPEDLAGTPEAPISEEIASLAASLGWSPVLIYEWVKNNIDTEWYWGCMKGAEGTLRQRRGNDCDQAALLTALYRAAGYPVRYVRGVIAFHPGIEAARHLTGVSDPREMAAFFQKAGIPHEPVVAGGTIRNFRIEHIWVEAQIPYANYRGAVLDEQGRTWIALDTSIKAAGYEARSTISVPSAFPLAAVRDEYLSMPRSETPLEYLRAELERVLSEVDPSLLYENLLGRRVLRPELLDILPASLQFETIKVTHEYEAIPEALLHQVQVTARRAHGAELFSIFLPAHQLSNREVTLVYESETVQDQEIINAYGGLESTPAYLVRIRPVLKVDGERLVVATDGLAIGEDYRLSIELISPHSTETVDNILFAGNDAAIGIVSQYAVIDSASADIANETAVSLLHREAVRYIDLWNRSEAELAALLRRVLIRPMPTVVTVGGVVDVTYLLDTPHDIDWRGLYVDADLRAVESVDAGAASVPDGERIFMQLASLEGSVLEHRLFEEDLQVESISTAKFLAMAAGSGVSLLQVDRDDPESLVRLAALPLDADIQEHIAHAVNQGLLVTLPETDLAYEDWRGIGYLVEDPQSGEAGWMLSGMIGGGMTVWTPDRWPEDLANRVRFSIWPNRNPSAAYRIQKNYTTDYQEGVVGEKLSRPLEVKVLDASGRRVQGAAVTFTVKAGGARFTNGQTSITRTTNFFGSASVELILGESTGSNPLFLRKPPQLHSEQVGGNAVEASLANGTGLATPFLAYAYPGETVRIRKAAGDGLVGPILFYSGFVSVFVEDGYGNPIANAPVRFEVRSPAGDRKPAYLIPMDAACLRQPPVHGACGNPADHTRSLPTDALGAQVAVVLGALPEETYTITATSGSLTETFTHRTTPHSGATELHMFAFYDADANGNFISAGKAGTTIPLFVKLICVKEYDIFPVDHASLTVNGTAGGSAEGGGLYRFEHTLASGLNQIHAAATAVIDGSETSAYTGIPVYGVGIELDPVPAIIVDGDGRATGDTAVRYTIQPTGSGGDDYAASSAYVVVTEDGVPINFIGSETRGQGFGILAKGFRFAPDRLYAVEVVLNYGSGAEIRSAAAPLRTVAVDLDVDSDNNSGVQADGVPEDPQRLETEEFMEDLGGEPGKVVRLNNRDRDRDGIPDFSDTEISGVDTGSGPSSDFVPLIFEIASAGDLSGATVRFDYPDADADADTGGGSAPWALRLWTRYATEPRSPVSIKIGGDRILSGEAYTLSELGGAGGGSLRFFVEGVGLSESPGDQRVEVAINVDGSGFRTADAVRLTVCDAVLVADYDRNRRIDEADRQRAMDEETFYFWINDDDDEGSTEGSDIPGDDSLLDTVDYKSPTVDGVRDLVDFFPVHVDLNALLKIFVAEDYSYVLKSEPENVNVVPTELGPESAGDYLTGSIDSLEPAASLGSVFTYPVGREGVDLERFEHENGFLTGAENGKGVLLVEGRKPGAAPLVLDVVQRATGRSIFETSRLDAPANFPDSACTGNASGAGKHFVFVHGYNVNGNQARGWQAEMFKRMYWSGSGAKFWGVTWYGWDTQMAGKTPNYHKNVIHAFETTAALKDFLADVVQGDITIAGHSLGNMVVSAALSDHADFWDNHPAVSIENYFMVNAAVPVEAYGPADMNDNMVHPQWVDYRSELWSSEWHGLFGAGDARTGLTWRDRFVHRPSNTRYYNFYSTGEEVLAEHTGYPSLPDIVIGLGRYAWVLQEKLKGRMSTNGVLGSSYGGWGFNLADEDYYTATQDGGGGEVDRIPIPAADANLIDPGQLKTRPFFKKGALDEPLFADESGSTHASEHRTRLLAQSFPATTLAAGAGVVEIFEQLNYHMQDMFQSEKGGVLRWPRSERDWRHSDAREIAYLYVYLLFDEFVAKGGLAQ